MSIRYTPNPKAVSELTRSGDMRRMVEKVATEGAEAAATRAPRNTGKLAASVGSTTELDGSQWVGLVYFGEWYGRLWEFGHKGKSKPFLRPGVQEVLSRYGGRFQSK